MNFIIYGKNIFNFVTVFAKLVLRYLHLSKHVENYFFTYYCQYIKIILYFDLYLTILNYKWYFFIKGDDKRGR